MAIDGDKKNPPFAVAYLALALQGPPVMKTTAIAATLVTVAFVCTPAFGQTAAAPRPRPTGTAGSAATPRSAVTHVTVRDVSGTPLEGVTVTVSGGGRGQAATDQKGVASLPLADGSYRLRFEREGFFTLEREVAIKNRLPVEVDVALNRAPPPPAPPEPPPPPPPPPAPVPAGPPVTISIPAFLEKNFIGREPIKESNLGCTPDAMTRLIQIKEPVEVHTHADGDEILYVVAGEGAIRLGSDATPVTAGSLTVIPRGSAHGIERRGKNPLIVVSTLAGAPCTASSPSHTAGK
jgi:hypothetical protein